MRRRLLDLAIWLLVLAPGFAIASRALLGELGANPIEELEHRTGAWAIRLLFATLAVTPLRRLAGWQALGRYRRRLGLAAFAYALAHFLTWSVLDNGLDLAAIAEDIVERPYVTVGFVAFVLLLPLAATSTRGAIRRLGRRWVKLHRLVYVAAVLAVVHHWWLVKKDLREPAVHAALLAILLASRLVPAPRRKRAQNPPPQRSTQPTSRPGRGPEP